jgi:hypothetical protein
MTPTVYRPPAPSACQPPASPRRSLLARVLLLLVLAGLLVAGQLLFTPAASAAPGETVKPADSVQAPLPAGPGEIADPGVLPPPPPPGPHGPDDIVAQPCTIPGNPQPCIPPDPCEEVPDHPDCPPPVSCEDDPAQDGCLPPCEENPDHPDCGPVTTCEDPAHPDYPCKPPVDCHDPAHPAHPCKQSPPTRIPTPTRIDTGAGGGFTGSFSTGVVLGWLVSAAGLGFALGAAAASRQRPVRDDG